ARACASASLPPRGTRRDARIGGRLLRRPLRPGAEGAREGGPGGVPSCALKDYDSRMLIRRATANDADALSDLAHRAKAHRGYPAAWMREWDAQLTIIPGYLELHDVYVAEEDGEIVGMCALEERRHPWHVQAE